MKTFPHDTRQVKMEKEFAWLMTIALVVTGLPLFKNAIVSILIKLYELLIQHVIGN